MIDFAYIAGTVLFFALMLGYSHACDRLGRASAAETARQEESHT